MGGRRSGDRSCAGVSALTPSRRAGTCRVALAAIALLLVVAPARAQVLIATSFEPDEPGAGAGSLPAGWEFVLLQPGSESSGSWDETTPHTGRRSLSIGSTDGASGFVSPRCSAALGEWVRATAWGRVWRLNGSARLGLVWVGNHDTVVATVRSAEVKGEEQWDRLSVEAVVPDSATGVRVFLEVRGSGLAWFDDVRLVKREEPPTHLSAISVGAAVQGATVPVQATIRTVHDALPSEAGVLSLVSLADGATSGEVEVTAAAVRRDADGQWVLGPLHVPVGRYAHLGSHFVRLRLGTLVLDSLSLPGGVFPVAPRAAGGNDASAVTLRLHSPNVGYAGTGLPVAVQAVASPPLGSAMASVGLISGRALYSETEVRLTPTGSSASGTETLRGAALLPVPPGLPPGSYTVSAALLAKTMGVRREDRTVEVHGQGTWARSLSHGLYRSASGVVHRWRTETSGMLIWDGYPYVPIGGMVRTRYLDEFDPLDPEGNQQRWDVFAGRTRALADAGVRDVYLATDERGLAGIPTEALQRVVDRFEELGFRYGVEIGGEAGGGFEGFCATRGVSVSGVEPGRVTAVTIPSLSVRPDARALVTLLPENGADPPRTAVVGLRNRLAQVLVESSPDNAGHTYTAYVTPETYVPAGVGAGDTADEAAFRAHKARVCAALEPLRFGDGLRFLANPLARDTGLPPADVFPAFPSAFPAKFAAWLALEYGADPAALETAWGTPGLGTFEAAGRLIPVAGPSGSAHVADPESGRTWRIDAAESSYASDAEQFRQDVQAHCLEDVIAAVKSICDVPVILDPEAAGQVVVPEGEGTPVLVRSSGGTGVHDTSSDPYYGPDGIAVAPPRVSDRLDVGSVAVRLAENLLCEHSPWVIATRVSPPLGAGPDRASPGALTSWARACGVRGMFVAWASDELADPFAPDIVSAPGALAALGAAATRGDALLDGAGPELVYAYPSRPRLTLGAGDDRPCSLDGIQSGHPALRIAEGKWLVPAPALRAESGGTYVVSLPHAKRFHHAARELDRVLSGTGSATFLLVGPREDLGLAPALDSLLQKTRVPTAFGGGEAQALASVEGLTACDPIDRGFPMLVRKGRLSLFPVVGLDTNAVLWLLGKPDETPPPPTTPAPTLRGLDADGDGR